MNEELKKKIEYIQKNEWATDEKIIEDLVKQGYKKEDIREALGLKAEDTKKIEKNVFKDIIKHNFFKWFAGFYLLSWIITQMDLRMDINVFFANLPLLGMSIALFYYWYQMNKEKDIKYKLAIAFLVLLLFVPFGGLIILYIMYEYIKNKNKIEAERDIIK